MPKLLVVATIAPTVNGFLLPYADHFSRCGWQVDVMVGGHDAVADEGCGVFRNVWRVTWSRSPFDFRSLLITPRKIRAIVERERYDIVHVHTPVAAFLTRWALRRRPSAGPTVIYTAHGFHFHPGGRRAANFVFASLERLAGRWTDFLVVINREDHTSALQKSIVPRDRVVFMPGIGVDTSAYSPARVTSAQLSALRGELGLSEDERYFLMIAEFNPGKRHRDLLEAFARLSDRKSKLFLAGTGPAERQIRQLAQDLHIAHSVVFLGYRHDIPVLLRGAAALVLPSEREGLPRSVLEAMCMGRPVIASRIRGVEDLLASGGGVMHSVGDVAEMAAAMQWVLEHPVEADAMGRRGRESVRTFDVSEVVALHEALYEGALGRGVAARANVG